MKPEKIFNVVTGNLATASRPCCQRLIDAENEVLVIFINRFIDTAIIGKKPIVVYLLLSL